jgi:hypothetical protein
MADRHRKRRREGPGAVFSAAEIRLIGAAIVAAAVAAVAASVLSGDIAATGFTAAARSSSAG